MWDKWKKKIENLIWKEIDEETNEELEQRQGVTSEIKTRIIYQYPKDSTYHIPQMKELKRKTSYLNNDMETPAFLRKNTRQEVESTTELHQTNKLNESAYEKKPFVNTDVPSPIYGYRDRKRKTEIESVPAYIRKKENVESTSNLEFTTIPRHDEQEDVQIKSSSPEQSTQLDHVSTDTMLQNETIELETSDQLDEQIEHEKQVSREDSLKEPETTQKVEEVHTKDYGNPRLTDSSQPKKKVVPYNVIMTPSDKRKQFLRQEQKRQLETTMNEKLPVEISERQQQAMPLHLLNDPVKKSNLNDQWLREQQRLLEQTLKHFQVRARVVNATQGPAVTRFEVHPELGVKVSKVKNLSDDLKLNMSARDIRIEAPIPGKNTIGIEVPNPSSQMVGLQEIINSNAFQESTSPLTIALGLNIEGVPVVTNIQKMPHGLIAGATGSGKSVCINAILLSIIYNAHHDDVKFLLIDPKMVELAPYNGIPHLVSPVITDVKAATQALKWAVNEMEERYERFVQEGVRDIERYNQKVEKQNRAAEKMPFIVIVIDELADLMMVSPQDVEDAISRIAQKARACGIHLLLATQRPSVDVLTGLIKANIPTRIAFSVSSQIDSRTIIDTAGAEKLLGKGDMLFIENGAGKSVRLQGPFVSDEEIERVTNYVRSIAEPDYLFEQESLLTQYVQEEEEDELLQEAIQFIFEHDSASTSLLQRHFKIGYNRAARLMDTLENKGIISGQNGSKPRDILITKAELDELLT